MRHPPIELLPNHECTGRVSFVVSNHVVTKLLRHWLAEIARARGVHADATYSQFLGQNAVNIVPFLKREDV